MFFFCLKINAEVFLVAKLLAALGGVVASLDEKTRIPFGKNQRSEEKAVGTRLLHGFHRKALIDQMLGGKDFLFPATDPLRFAEIWERIRSQKN